MDTKRLWQLALDQPDSASAVTIRRGWWFAAILVVAGIVVVIAGGVQLRAYPQFATFHAGFVFLVDALTAILLFGQFTYRRLLFYAILAAGYLFNAFVVIPFLLTFPGALEAKGVVIGGNQSAIWVWHYWHILFPVTVAAAMLAQRRQGNGAVSKAQVNRYIIAAVIATVLLVVVVALAVTVLHEHLPVLITSARRPLTGAFYLIGSVAAMTTLGALMLVLPGAREHRTLHIWLAVALVAMLADVAASLGAYARFTVGWYFGRAESMFATSVLLLVLINEINRLYSRLASTMDQLVATNTQLSATVNEKETLVSELQASEEQVRQLAYYDAVTQLPNRWLLLERLHQSLAQGARYGHSTALLFMDLDNFKRINDTLGHEVGDALLRAVGQRIAHSVRSGDTAARLGGDEFVIVLPEVDQVHDATVVAEKVLKALNEPLEVGDNRMRVTISIGIATHAPNDGFDANELMRRADIAMYQAKKSGRNRYCISEGG